MKSKTTKDIGNELEEIIVSFIKKIEPYCRRTKGSGNGTELEDVLSKYFMVQAKADNVHSNIIIHFNDYKQLLNALPINSKRIPIFVNKQKEGLVTVTLNIEDYFRTIYKCFEFTGDIK